MKTPSISGRFATLAAALVLGSGLTAVAVSGGAASASARDGTKVNVPVFALPLSKVAQVNLSKLAGSSAGAKSFARSRTTRYREVDNSIIDHARAASLPACPIPHTTAITNTNVPGESGFSALGGVQQASTTGGSDLEPPDQGLCAGGGYVMEFINNAIAVYSENGAQLVGPGRLRYALLQPTTDFFSDPRCYYDAPTQRWFFQEFIVGNFNSSGGS